MQQHRALHSFKIIAVAIFTICSVGSWVISSVCVDWEVRGKSESLERDAHHDEVFLTLKSVRRDPLGRVALRAQMLLAQEEIDKGGIQGAYLMGECLLEDRSIQCKSPSKEYFRTVVRLARDQAARGNHLERALLETYFLQFGKDPRYAGILRGYWFAVCPSFSTGLAEYVGFTEWSVLEPPKDWK